MEETPKTSGGSKMPVIIIGVIIVLAIIGLAGVKILTKSSPPTMEEAMGSQQMTAETSVTPSAPTATPSGEAMAAETSADEKVITMDAGSYYYSVKTIDVKKGQKVKIVMTSKDMMHNLNIDELNVHLPLTKAGETNTVEFTADKIGTFEYYCSVGQHRKLGQVGKITVTE